MSTETHPASNWYAVTPHDTNELDPVPRALYITADGNINIVGANGNAEVFPVVTGQTIACRAKIVMATSTTASCIALHD